MTNCAVDQAVTHHEALWPEKKTKKQTTTTNTVLKHVNLFHTHVVVDGLSEAGQVLHGCFPVLHEDLRGQFSPQRAQSVPVCGRNLTRKRNSVATRLNTRKTICHSGHGSAVNY